MHLHALTTRLRSSAGFTLVELMVVIAIVAILAVVAIPLLLGSREKAWVSACDHNYGAVVGDLQNQLDSQVNAGNPDAARDVLDAFVPAHVQEKNPRDKNEEAYVDNDVCGVFVASAASSCQVFLCYDGGTEMVLSQYGRAPRSFRIAVR